MTDVRQFLRYSLPGVACIIQLLVALTITDWYWLYSASVHFSLGGSSAFVIGAFLASGGLGYCLSLIYWGLYWWDWIAERYAIDHSTVLSMLGPKIEIKGFEAKNSQVNSLSRRQAWDVVGTYWYSRYKNSDYIRSINKQVDRMVDITHSIGTTFIGSCLALIAWMLIHIFHSSDRVSITAGCVLVLWILLLCLIWSNYRTTLCKLQAMLNSTLTETINKEYARKGSKITIWYSV